MAALGAVLAVVATEATAGFTSPLPCTTRTLSTPFASLGDGASYFLVSNGGFEKGATDWTLSGKAKQVSGNESFYVSSTADRYSLSLPTSSSATTRGMCVGGGEYYVRFFAKNPGSLASTLKVEVLTEDASGKISSTLIGAVVSSGGAWTASSAMYFGVSGTQVLGGNVNVAFRFTPSGSNGAWQIDDVYVDPFKQ